MAKKTVGEAVLDLVDAAVRSMHRNPPAFSKSELKRLPKAFDALRKAGATVEEIAAIHSLMELTFTPTQQGEEV